MSLLKIRPALEKALLAVTPTFSTAWEATEFTPVSGTPYQKVHLLLARPDNSEYGISHREQGIFQVTLMYPLLTGTKAATTRAELLRTAFKRGTTFSYGGVKVIVDRTPEIVTGARDGDRWAIPVKISWHTQIS